MKDKNFLYQMSGKRLRDYIKRLEYWIFSEDNPRNRDIFKGWLVDANKELDARNKRKENYLRGMKYGN